MGDCQLVISRNYDHAYQVYHKEPLVYRINLAKIIGSIKLQLESVHAPEYHEADLRNVEKEP